MVLDSKGELYIVATPIGNIEDITLRALKILKRVDLIISEDTRTARKLLNHFEIKNRTASYYSPKEIYKADYYLDQIMQGKKLALISESGTPCISDPGIEIVRRAYERGITVIPIPGPTSIAAAVCASGLKTDEFFFTGFLPRKKGARKRALEKHLNAGYPFIFFDSKYRIKDTITFLGELEPARRLCVAREITKKFEEFIRGTAEDVAGVFNEKKNIKGEFVVVCSASGK